MSLNFNQYAAEGNRFLNEYAREINMPEEKDRAGRIFISIMHALRDIITPQESLQLIAQLPTFIKAAYVNGWALKEKKPKVRKISDFIALVKAHDQPTADYDFEYNDEKAERFTEITFMYLRKYVSEGELNDIRDGLPKDLKGLLFSNMSL